MTTSLQDRYVSKIAGELSLGIRQVHAVVALLDEGATVPFIARYRKEMTGSLDEVVVTAIRDRIRQLRELDRRREAILASLEERELLTDELKEKLETAETMTELEDIYLPYRPKRRTRATVAKERGLEPLARLLFEQGDIDPEAEARAFVNPEKEVPTVEDALAGARDIIAEWVSEHKEAREHMRTLFSSKGIVRAKAIAGKEEAGANYRDYYGWEEPAEKAPSHRILAMFRGESELILTVRVVAPEEEALAVLERLFIKGG